MEAEQYRTAGGQAEAELIEKKSRFIGHIRPVQTEEQAVAFVQEIRSGRRDASHNVYAYVLREGSKLRHSDDGEPQGTAGLPVLEVLTKNGVVDAAVVVTRYFGGILLGAGGLVRAYSKCAALALEQAGVAVMARCLEGKIVCEYAQYGAVQALLPGCGGSVDETLFGERVAVRFHLLPENVPAFTQKLADATNGQAAAEWLGQRFLRL